jgi:hypothetical protein
MRMTPEAVQQYSIDTAVLSTREPIIVSREAKNHAPDSTT